MTTEVDFDFDNGIIGEVDTKPATCRLNKEKSGIELRFPGKPTYSIIGALKDAKWHWHRTGKFWYHKDTPEARKVASQFADIPE